jgi:hypothetical protein
MEGSHEYLFGKEQYNSAGGMWINFRVALSEGFILPFGYTL